MNKIQRVSRLFKWVFMLCFGLLPMFLVFVWFLSASVGLKPGHNGVTLSYIPSDIIVMHSLSAMTRFYAFLAGLIPLAVNLSILYLLIKLFSLFEACKVFGAASVRYIKYIAYAIFASQLLHPVYHMLLSFILTQNNPVGHRVVSVDFSGTNLALLLLAALMILVSWIMSEAYQIQEEQQLTI